MFVNTLYITILWVVLCTLEGCEIISKFAVFIVKQYNIIQSLVVNSSKPLMATESTHTHTQSTNKALINHKLTLVPKDPSGTHDTLK